MPARASLATDLKRCQLIRGIENGYDDPPVSAFDAAVVGTLRAAVAVLMVASFEEFVRALFDEKLTLLTRTVSGHDLSAYHITLHLESILGGLSLALNGRPSEKKRSLERRGDILALCGAIAGDQLVVEALSNVGSNPKGDRIVSMLERVGVEDVVNNLDKRYRKRFGPCAKRFVVEKLNSIVNLRHSVAHTGQALLTSRVELDDNLVFLERAATVLEATLDDFVTEAKANAATGSGGAKNKVKLP